MTTLVLFLAFGIVAFAAGIIVGAGYAHYRDEWKKWRPWAASIKLSRINYLRFILSK
jgi:hypothetical protein